MKEMNRYRKCKYCRQEYIFDCFRKIDCCSEKCLINYFRITGAGIVPELPVTTNAEKERTILKINQELMLKGTLKERIERYKNRGLEI